MTESFFQERFKRNLKFYEGKTPEEIEQKYELLYGELSLKDIYLAELSIIKKLLGKEKLSKKDSSNVNFEDYLTEINNLYSKIENMNESDIENNKEKIEMIIASIKLSLNSPVYFKVNIEKLKEYNLNYELNEFIRGEIQQNQRTNELIKLKETLTQEVEKKQQSIEKLKEQIRSTETLDKLEELYWKLMNNEIDIYGFMIVAFALDLNKKEKDGLLEAISKVNQYNDARSIEKFNRRLSYIVSDFKRDNNIISTKIVDIERRISMITKISQNIDANGHFIQSISDELIDEYINQINTLDLDVINLTREILKEQSRIVRKQRIEQIARTIERKTSTLTKTIKPKEKKTQISVPNQYSEILEAAKKIVETLSSNYNLELDEIESMFVEELTNSSVDKTTIEDTFKSARDEECELKFIYHGLSYQLAHLDQLNIEKSINIILKYIKKFENCQQRINEEKDKQQAFEKQIDEMRKDISTLKSQIETDVFEQLGTEKIKNLDSYKGIDFENMDEEAQKEIETGLNQFELNLEMLKLYKSYVLLKNTIEETELYINLIEEDMEFDLLSQVREKIKLIGDLLKQYNESKRIYEEESKIKETEELQVENTIDNDENIIVYFEQENGTIQAVERIKEDLKVYGSYKQSELEKVKHLLDYMKTSTPEEIKSISVPIKSDLYPNVSFGYRAKLGGNIRIAYHQLSSDVLGTERPVYLIVSIGKKETNTSDVYEDAISNIGRIDDFIKKNYKTLLNATPEQKKEFLKKQKEIEEQITNALTKGRGELHGTKR